MTEIAIVTGASRGIGAAIARLLGRSGYAVCVNFQSDAAGAGKVVGDIERSGGRAIAVRADVSDPTQIAEIFEEVDSRLGTLSALVNNAGDPRPAVSLRVALARGFGSGAGRQRARSDGVHSAGSTPDVDAAGGAMAAPLSTFLQAPPTLATRAMAFTTPSPKAR